MLRKISVYDLITMASGPVEPPVQFFHDELKQADPNEEVVRAFVTHHPSLCGVSNESGSIAAHIICNSVNTVPLEIIRIVYDAYPQGFATPNQFGMLPIHKAVSAPGSTSSSFDSIKAITDFYPEGLRVGNLEGQLPLHLALSKPRVPDYFVIEYFLSVYPEAVKVADKYGQLPIHKACAKQKIDVEVIELLLKDRGRDVASFADNNGLLPMHWIMTKDHPSLDIIHTLYDAYPEALFERDNAGLVPFDKLIQKKIRVPEAEEVVLELTMLTKYNMEARAKALAAERKRESSVSRQSTSNTAIARQASERRRNSKFLGKQGSSML